MTIRAERVGVTPRHVRLEIGRYVPGAVLTAYGIFILSLYLRGVMTMYINPMYIWPTTIAGVVLLGIGLLGLIRARTGEHVGCGCEDGCSCNSCSPASPRRLWPYGALCIPLFLAVVLPPQGLAAFSALQRGPQIAGLSVIHNVSAVQHVSLSVDTGTFSLQDWAGALSADPNPKDYTGKAVNISGMVLSSPGTAPPGYIMVMRYQVTCCIADAQPIGLIVKDTTHGALKSNDWVKVSGVMGSTKYQGNSIAVVLPKSMTQIKPGNPYMY